MMDLKQRMAATKLGQVSWVDPEKKARCSACAHFAVLPKPTKGGNGRCAMVRVFTKKDGQPLHGDLAMACSKYEARK